MKCKALLFNVIQYKVKDLNLNEYLIEYLNNVFLSLKERNILHLPNFQCQTKI